MKINYMFDIANRERKKSYLEKVQEFDADIKALQEDRQGLLAEWVENEAPHKIGDVVEVPGYHPFEGKKMKITGISVRRTWVTYAWRFTGCILKKDGKPGLNTTSFKVAVDRI